MKKCILGLGVLLLCSCQSDENGGNKFEPKERKDIELTRSEQDMVNVGNDFAFNLLKTIDVSEKKDNYFISPLSASLALAMTTNGAANNTLAEMKRTLGFDSYSLEEMNGLYKKLVGGLLDVDNTTQLGIANSIWIRQNFPVLEPFKEVNKNMYDAEVRNLDFDSPQAAPTINQWCADKTNNCIKEVIKQISSGTQMYLINALYFKGIWKNQFDAKHTTKAPFTSKDGSRAQVNMMKQEATLSYTEDTDLKIAELPYGNEAFSMVVLLPQGNNTPEHVIGGLTPAKWSTWMQNLSTGKANLLVSFPKFKMEYERELNGDLIALGMREAFYGDLADFSKMSDIHLFISLVKQKTFVEVNEEGTEAAAVTVVETLTTSVDPSTPIVFSVDRPFVYAIKEKSTGTILFIGKMGSMK